MATTQSSGLPDSSSIPPKDRILETGAALTQDFAPLKSVCAHLCAWHVYADVGVGNGDGSMDVNNDRIREERKRRAVESHHYCMHLTADIRQCLIFDRPTNPARLIGVEYMITKKLYEGLDADERKLWHSHDFEVRSGMLVMPNPTVPNAIWEVAETAEMREVVGLYGKTYHMWQVDRGDQLPLGPPQLMMSFTKDEQIPWDKVRDRDQRYSVNTMQKREKRTNIGGVEIHPDADSCWK